MNRKRLIQTLTLLAALALTGTKAGAQALDAETLFRSDTLSLRIEFPAEEASVQLGYGRNRQNSDEFRAALERALAAPGAFMSGVFIHTMASPDGNTTENIRLSDERAENVRAYLCNSLGLSPFIVHVTSDGENWKDLATAVAALPADECPWKDRALAIIREKPLWDINGEQVEDRRKILLRRLNGGAAWSYLTQNVFPKMRTTYGDAMFVVSIPVEKSAALKEIVEVQTVQTVHDTVVVEKKVYFDPFLEGKVDRRFKTRLVGKKFLFAIRTNLLAVPMANLGVELPFGTNVSLGLDIYYPWIQRNKYHKDCTEMIAYGMDVRYWLGSDRFPDKARLLGHSFGLYGAGGHYDFERDWTGHQGTFFNIGVDWMYAFPLFHGRMHMEIELGLGMIFSKAQPYDVFEPYGDGFRRPGEMKIVRWYGPTKAQLSLVVPIYGSEYTRRK